MISWALRRASGRSGSGSSLDFGIDASPTSTGTTRRPARCRLSVISNRTQSSGLSSRRLPSSSVPHHSGPITTSVTAQLESDRFIASTKSSPISMDAMS